MNKTIVMIGNTSWSMFQFRADLMREFIKKGHHVVVIAPKDEWSSHLQSLGAHYIEAPLDRKGTNPVKDFLYTFTLVKILLKLKADIVLSYTVKPVLYGTLAAWIANVPQRIAITTGLGYTFTHKTWITKFTKFLYKNLLRFSTETWFLNRDDLEIFVREKLIKKEKAFLLPGEGVNTDFYKPSPRENQATTFTLIARMLWDKGVGHYVEAAKEIKKTHPEIIFNLVGPVDEGNPEGIPMAKLQEWHKLGIVQYLGQTNDVRPILRDTDCLVHPTYYREGLPRVLMEANAMGIPCITTDIPGCRDVIIEGINGFLVPPKDQKALKTCIMNFVSLHSSIKKDISALARDRVERNYSSFMINDTYASRLAL